MTAPPLADATDPTDPTAGVDPHDVAFALSAPEPLAPFNLAGVLAPGDIHTAATLARLTGEDRDDVLLAAALAVRAPRLGHVCLDLEDVAATVTADEEQPLSADELEWPAPDAWRRRIATSPLVRERAPDDERPDPATDRPLTLVGSRLYLDRFWRHEVRTAVMLRRRADRLADDVDPVAVRAVLDRLLPPAGERPDRQRLAAATAALRRLAVVAGGPGTGKTYTAARILALLHELASPEGRPARAPRVAVAAPTGKAADRVGATLRLAARQLDTPAWVAQRLRTIDAMTIHRLLGWRPNPTRFAHDRARKLPHEIVLVDETSMVSLALMARLLEALRPDTRLILLGDPNQLVSVEAGAVLGDVVGPVGSSLRMTPRQRDRLAAATGEPLDDVATVRPSETPVMRETVTVLGGVRRYAPGSGVARLAEAVLAGDADAAVGVLRGGAGDVTWIDAVGVPTGPRDADADAMTEDEIAAVRAVVVDGALRTVAAADAGDPAAALAALGDVRVLCAHRRGPSGVAGWNTAVEHWLTEHDVDTSGRFYVGRPLLVTRNDRRTGLFNGDLGVVVRRDHAAEAVFAGSDGPRRFGPGRLEDLETVHAMTVHKSQGSEFEHVVVVLPDADSPILTRELVYTAITRARQRVTVIGVEDALRAAIGRPVARASGLRRALWGPEATPPGPAGDHAGPTAGRRA